jgi:hypothetical protein
VDIIETLLLWFSGFLIGYWFANYRLIARLLSNPDGVIKLLEKYKREDSAGESTDFNPLRVERHADVIYLFNDKTNEFLAQGTTLQEALDLVNKRFPDMNFKGHLSKEQVDALDIKV